MSNNLTINSIVLHANVKAYREYRVQTLQINNYKKLGLYKCKPSKYNHLFPISDNEILAFNTKSSCMIKTSIRYMPYLKNALKGNVISDPVFIEFLYENGFIIPDNYDEIIDMKIDTFYTRFKTDSICFTILPTLSCNFKCPYCYQDADNQKGIYKIDVKTQNAVIKTLERSLGIITCCKIIWYGGEPLLAPEVIDNISKHVIKLCEKTGVHYNSTLITNGYLLNKKNVKLLQKSKINTIQITIDGEEDLHNKMRPLKNGDGTFRNILDNLIYATEKIPHVTVRANVDKSNIDTIPALLHVLRQSNLQNKISFYIGKIFDNTCVPFKHYSKKNYLSVEEFKEKEIKIYNLMNELGFSFPNFPLFLKLKASNCIATDANSFVVDPIGNMYRCISDIGDQSRIIGNINTTIIKAGIGDKNISYCKQYMSFDATTLSDCKNCNILPVCMGECPKQFIDNTRKKTCYLKNRFEDVLKFYANIFFNRTTT